MPTDYEFIAEALEHFIDRMENIKNDDEVREGGDILIKDIEDNIKRLNLQFLRFPKLKMEQ